MILPLTFLWTLAVIAGAGGLAALTRYHFIRREGRGIYFDKKSYTPESPPAFSNLQKNLPEPILDSNPDWINLYWRAWEIAFSNIRQPKADSPLVSNWLDAAFSDDCLFQWDITFIVMFARYGHHIFPAVQSLDNFYARQHDDGLLRRISTSPKINSEQNSQGFQSICYF